jgi:hypothetical protein
VPRLVRRRDHVLERPLGQDLRLVEDLDVDLVEAAAEALFASAEHDPRAVAEPDLLLPVRRTRLEHEGPHLLARRKALHL